MARVREAKERCSQFINSGEVVMKLDNGKVRPSLVLGDMANAILAVSEVATFGAAKYSDGNWLLVAEGIKRYTDAKDRHRLEGSISEVDSESDLLHAAHEAWNALAVLELKLRSKKVFNVTEEAMVKESLGRAVLRASEEAKRNY